MAYLVTGQTEGALAEADGRGEVTREGESASVSDEELGGETLDRRVLPGNLDEACREVDAERPEPAPCQFQTMPSWTTANVEDTRSCREREQIKQEVDLLHSALGERELEIRFTQKVADRSVEGGIIGHAGLLPSCAARLETRSDILKILQATITGAAGMLQTSSPCQKTHLPLWPKEARYLPRGMPHCTLLLLLVHAYSRCAMPVRR